MSAHLYFGCVQVEHGVGAGGTLMYSLTILVRIIGAGGSTAQPDARSATQVTMTRSMTVPPTHPRLTNVRCTDEGRCSTKATTGRHTHTPRCPQLPGEHTKSIRAGGSKLEFCHPLAPANYVA